jgi:hypothetical protein
MAKNKRGYVPEEERCKGTSRQSGLPCKRRRSPGSEYCIFHGGRTPKGGAHPNFKDGKRSRYMLAPEIFEHFNRYLNDPELTNHRDSIALTDAMIQEALDDFYGGGTPELWRNINAAWRRVEKARKRGDGVRLGEALDRVGLLIDRGTRDVQGHERVLKLLNERRKHASAETKRRLAEEYTFTYEEAAAYYAALGAAVTKHVHNRETRVAILNEITAIAGRLSIAVPPAQEAERRPDEEG